MATEREAYQTELLAEDEPRYLRRQRPLEIRRRKFGRRSWQLYRRVLVGGTLALVGGWLFYETVHFFLHSPRVLLASLEQIELIGNHYVSRAAVLERFAADRGRSILRVPLAKRRRALEEMPWVEHANVERILPNRIRVELVERTPVAFLRLATELALVDAYGVILELPLAGDFRFPVVAGLAETMPREARGQRMKLYVQFLKEIELIRAGAAGHVSEVDLSDEKDLRAVLAGVAALGAAAASDQGPVLVHFGDGDFVNKFRLFVENIGQWRATAGRVESVDLRFARQVVVNPEAKTTAAKTAQQAGPAAKPR
jgi:cell division protein FtsQ